MGRLIICSQIMYTRCQIQRTCLHSSMHDCAMQQNRRIGFRIGVDGAEPGGDAGSEFPAKTGLYRVVLDPVGSWPT
ncbi:hypothetical protein ACVIWU_005170 [Bradyrhizobium sp. USDA 4509]|nr:hypothetical protein [Bradyrhizobium sp. USDA 4541]